MSLSWFLECIAVLMLQIECRNLDPPTYILCVYKTLIVISAIIPHPFRRNNEVKLLLRVFMFIFLALFTILAQSPSSTFLFSTMFFVGADPPLSLDLSASHKQPLAVVFHPFSHFSVTFIATVSHNHTGLKFCQTHSQLFPASPGLLLANK